MAVTQSCYSKSVLIELLKIKTMVKGAEIACSNRRSKYPEQYAADYRVCDFALLNMAGSTRKMDSPETRDREIAKIPNKK